MPKLPSPLELLFNQLVETVLVPRMDQMLDRLTDSFQPIIPPQPRTRRVASSRPTATRSTREPRQPAPTRPHTPTHYDVLEVSPHASAETIQAAHRSLVMRFHPDKNKTKAAAERMIRINEAWGVLQDGEKRKAYDRKLRIG